MATRATAPVRYSFGNLKEPLELPDLIAVQRESFQWFLDEGLANTFRDISPIKDFSESLQLELEFDPFDEDLRPPPKFTVEECKEKDMTYSAPVFVRARFMNRNTGEIKEQTVFMGDFPIMTEKGTFIVNGTERVVVSQLVRSPGVIFEPGERSACVTSPSTSSSRAPFTRTAVNGWSSTSSTSRARTSPLAPAWPASAASVSSPCCVRSATTKRMLPASSTAFVSHFDFLEGQWDKERDTGADPGRSSLEIYKRARPGEPPTVESAKAYFRNAFFESRRYDLSRVGRYKINRKLGEEISQLGALFGLEGAVNGEGEPLLDYPEDDQNVLSRCEVLATITYMLHLVKQSRVTASTTRTTSPTAAFAASASSSRTRSASASAGWNVSSANA